MQATEIDPHNYFGVTVANGMTGIVSSPEPLKVKGVVLNKRRPEEGRKEECEPKVIRSFREQRK